MLLGLGKDNAFFRPLTVKEILVVTFTEAAKEELRRRIRNNIHELRLACVRPKNQKSLFSDLLNEIEDISNAAAQLLLAEQQIDEAAIYTIHGFCHRMVTHYAFEFGMLFKQTLIKDEIVLRRQACADFWRRHFYPLPLAIAHLVSQEWSDPEAFLADISSYWNVEEPMLRKLHTNEETMLMHHAKMITSIDTVKLYWKRISCELEILILQSDIDKRSYNRKNLLNWFCKVNEWTMKETLDYQLPKALYNFRQSVLLQKTKHGQAPHHELFIAIDELFSTPLTLRYLIISRALSEIRRSIQYEKKKRSELSFDDLLAQMDTVLQSTDGEKLAQSIRQQYPVAIIDEFQDTDPKQYRIFKKLYIGQLNCSLLLIGDPKQAIYSFRGADIFTYMRAYSEITAHYTLDTNWRSSPAMVDSINRLFCQLDKPFLLGQINFKKVSAAQKNQGLVFQLHNQSQPAIQFWLQTGKLISANNYQQLMARLCATKIRDWLTAGQKGQAWLYNGIFRRSVQASNITVLVRNRNEADLVCNALSALSIPSCYLSNQDSIFDTPEAKDLLWLLQAVLAPEKQYKLRSAMATGLMGLDAIKISALTNDEYVWNALVDEFGKYRALWRQSGILSMLNEIMKIHHIAENLLASDGGEQRITNVLHLAELLQEVTVQLESDSALVRWLSQKITTTNRESDHHPLRLVNDCHLVQVISIHKSKGLEFDLVFLPFIVNFRESKEKHFHGNSSNTAILSLVEKTRLAEDLRLLYVALTRSVYHTSIGIAPLIHYGIRNKQNNTDVHRSALGYLIQAGQSGDSVYLYERLQHLTDSGISLSKIESLNEEAWENKTLTSKKLAAKHFTRHIQDFWHITSYTQLIQQSSSSIQKYITPPFDGDVTMEKKVNSELTYTPHTFPRGAASGIFLHNVLKTLNYTEPLDDYLILQQLQQQGLADDWHPVLLTWIRVILNTPINEKGLFLAGLGTQDKQAELQFYMPINRLLQAKDLDALVKRYDTLSSRCPTLDFQQVQGMLKGFIDLVFYWKGKYYLLDYKSNWLGEDSSAYTRASIEKEIMKHRYDLQYQLYTLALHRYLRHRLVDYDYNRHFGDVIYLFLRGVDKAVLGNGIFSCRLEKKLVEDIDLLFNGHAITKDQ